jgi:hypothetical protein
MSAQDQHDQTLLSELALHLGMIGGALSRPGVREGLIAMLAESPAGNFSYVATLTAYRHLGQVLEAVKVKRS